MAKWFYVVYSGFMWLSGFIWLRVAKSGEVEKVAKKVAKSGENSG